MSNNKSRSSKPYDSSNSFVKKVASRVSGLIPRSTSWLSGWFSPTTGSEQGSSSRQEEITNEGEQFEDALSVEQPPPSKRLKLSANPPQFVGAFPRCQTGDQGENSSRHVPNNFIDTSAIPGTSGQGMRSGGFVASTPAVTSVEHLEPKANGDDCSESGESTSGCSSLEPQINRGLPNTQSQTRQIESMSPRKRLHEDKLNYSYLQSSRSLFLDHTSNSHNKTVGRRNNPSFCVNTFGTPLFGGRGNVNDLILNSPFYAGRTTYGGASSASYRRSLGSASLSSSPANSEKLARHTIKVKPGNSHVAEDTSMSQTAKRILATLEQFSTPILDAKRIPVNQQPALSSLGSRKRSRLNEAQHSLEQPQIPKRCLNKPLHWAKGAPNTSQLTIPLTPDTLIHRRRELVHDSTPAISPAGSIADNYKLRTEADNNLTTRNTLKMKPRITDKDPKEPELGIEVHLPEVPLPISSLPVLDISVPAPKDVSKITPGSALLSGISSMNKPLASSGNLPATLSSFSTSPSKSNAEGTFSDASFSFSSPIKVSAEVKDRPVSSMNSFTFSKPLPASLKFAEPSANSMKARPKASSDNPSPKVEFPCGLKPASELKTGSVMDILGKGTTNTSKSISSSANGTISPMDKLKPAAGTWECNKCLIRNKSDQAKCACEDPREENTKLLSTDSSESKMSSTSPNLKKDADFGAQFKMSQGMWECSACMLRNKDADSKCVACTTPKPSAAPPKTASSAAILSSWGDKFKPPSGTWECNVCMVRNGPELSACQSCTTQKPGASSESSAPVSVKSSWGDQFKKPEGSWTCSECMITNKAADTKCVACMTKKPGAPPSPKQGLQFSFGVPPGNSSETNTPATTSFSIVPKTTKEGNDSDKSSVSSSTGFKFGESKSETPTVTFSFGIPQSSTLTVPTSTNSLVPASDSLPRAIPISSPPSMNSCLFGVKVADVTPPPSVVITNDSKTTPTFGAAVALEEKSNAVPLFSFSKPPESSVLSQPASSTVSPLGGKRKFGGDASSSSSPPIKFGIATDQASLVKPEVTTMSSVSSTSGSVFSPSSASSVCNPAVTALSGTVTSSASSQTTVEVVKTSSSSPFLGASPTAAPTPKLVVTFGLNAAAKDESVTSTWKPAVSNNTVDDQKLSTDNGVGAPKGGFSFGSTVSSSGMAFGSSTIPGTATFSFGASTDKTATPNKTIAFGTPASSTTLFGSGIGNLAGSSPSFGTPSGTGFGSLTSSSNTSQGFPASNSITSSFTSPPSSAFPSSFGSTSEEKKPMFSFGTATEPKKSGYFFSPPDEKKPFSFGSAAGTAATTTQNAFSAASSGVFTFGSSAPAANGPEKVDFALGANQSSTFPNFTSSQQSTTGGFSYIGASPSFGSGANSTPTVTTPFAGATSPAAFAASTSFSSAFTPANSQPTGFNFSTSGANSFGTQNPSPFSFGNGADKPTFNFNAGGPTALPTTSDTTGSTVPPRRAYLKAARRNKPTMR